MYPSQTNLPINTSEINSGVLRTFEASSYFIKSTNTIINIIITKMRIINNRQIISQLFRKRNAYLFSNIRKKPNRNFSLNVLKQQHDQDSDRSLKAKLSNNIWELPQNKIENFEDQGLKHLEEAFKFRIAQTEIMKMHLESGNISQQTKQSNSQAFIKLISHSLSSERCDQIINLIQAHCQQIKRQAYQKINFINPTLRNYQSTRKNQEALFQKIQGIMLEDMLLDESTKEDNTQYINHLMKILAESNLFSISHEAYGQNSHIQDGEDYKPVEIRNFLNSEYLNQAHRTEQTHQLSYLRKNEPRENQSENRLDKTVKNRQNQKAKIYIKTARKVTAPRQIKVKVAPEEDIFFTKVNTQQDKDQLFKIQQSKKYAYIYDLPFLITNNECKELIEHIQNTKGVKIISHKLFNYGSYFEIPTKQKKFHIPQFYETDLSIQKIYEEVDIQTYLNSQKNAKKSKTKSKEQPTGLSWTTQALLKKVKKQHYSMFNRSILVAQFQSEQQKKKCISPEARLYGINYKNMKNIKFEEGHSKTVVRLHGIPPGCTTTELNQFLNQTFSSFGYNFQVEQDLYLSKKYILIKFQHFVEVLKAIELLQNRTFQEKQLKAEIIYGSSKVFKENFATNLNDTREQLKERVIEVSRKYYMINDEKQQ